jgi:hypothetical protein
MAAPYRMLRESDKSEYNRQALFPEVHGEINCVVDFSSTL